MSVVGCGLGPADDCTGVLASTVLEDLDVSDELASLPDELDDDAPTAPAAPAGVASPVGWLEASTVLRHTGQVSCCR